MTEEENRTMERLGITCETTTTFQFAGYKYQRLEDAVNYAKKNSTPAAGTPTEPNLKTKHE